MAVVAVTLFEVVAVVALVVSIDPAFSGIDFLTDSCWLPLSPLEDVWIA